MPWRRADGRHSRLARRARVAIQGRAMARLTKHHFQDDFLNSLVFEIEFCVAGMDADAAKAGLRLTDSQVKSALTRIKANLGKPTAVKARDESPREVLLGKLAGVLHYRTQTVTAKETEDEPGEGSPIPPQEWALAYDMVLRSMNLRKSPEPGARAYLDFLPGFLNRVAGE